METIEDIEKRLSYLKKVNKVESIPEDNSPTINKPTPKEPEVIPPIKKPEDLTPEPLEPEVDDDDIDEGELRQKGFLHESQISKVIEFEKEELRKQFEQEKKRLDSLKICPSCGEKSLSQRFTKCPICDERELKPTEKRVQEEQNRLKEKEAQNKKRAAELQKQMEENELNIARVIEFQKLKLKQAKESPSIVYQLPEKPPEKPFVRIEPQPIKRS